MPAQAWRSRTAIAALGMLCAAPGAHARAVPPPAVPDTIAQRTVACAACHGKEGRATSEGFFPRIAGKPAGYLYNQLLNFRDGRRQYPGMTYLVAHLSDDYLKEIAGHFAGLHLPYAPPATIAMSPQVAAAAQKLVLQGDAQRKLPACVACHGERLTGVQPAIPGTIGLPRDYLVAQLGAWKNGSRKAAAPDCMAQISRQLTADEIGALSSWLASRPLPADMTPAAALSTPLPLDCGSVPGAAPAAAASAAAASAGAGK